MGLDHSPKKTVTKSLNTPKSTIPADNSSDSVSPKGKATASNAVSPKKIQTGMDRYLKRTRSPQSSTSGQISKKHAPLQNNRFAILGSLTEKKDSAPTKKIRPPPIFLREKSSNTLVNQLVKLLGSGNFHVTPIKRGNIHETKIQSYDENGYRSITKVLKDESKNFYTYQLKSSKGMQVVIKGIESSVDVNEIKEALIEKGFKAKTVMNIFNRNKIPQPMFKIELEPEPLKLKKNEVHPIYSMQYLLHRKISVDDVHKRNGPVQCSNCQEYGHTKTYCTLRTVCVVCGELHPSSQCTMNKNVEKKCSNCAGNHTANYRGCPVFKDLKNKLKNKINKLESAKIPGLIQNKSTSSYVDNKVSAGISYASVIKNSGQTTIEQSREELTTAPKDVEAMIFNLTQCMTQFMSNMQSMLQSFMVSQNQLIQKILSVK